MKTDQSAVQSESTRVKEGNQSKTRNGWYIQKQQTIFFHNKSQKKICNKTSEGRWNWQKESNGILNT